MLNRRSVLTLFASTAIVMSGAASAFAAPAPDLVDDHWTTFGDTTGVDHSAWTEFLTAYVSPSPDGVNRVDYTAAKKDQASLKSYITELEAMDPTTLTKDEAMAFWINLYNAKTVDVVLDNYPVKSIREIGGGVFSRGPWNDKVSQIGGRSLSLNDMEHGILRPIWKDPRIHYAVNCASIGCPNQRTQAFSPQTLEEDLDSAARDYITNPRGAELTSRGLIVSSIYKWYKVDFGNDDAGVIAHLAKYGGPTGATSILDDRYDWALNDTK